MLILLISIAILFCISVYHIEKIFLRKSIINQKIEEINRNFSDSESSKSKSNFGFFGKFIYLYNKNFQLNRNILKGNAGEDVEKIFGIPKKLFSFKIIFAFFGFLVSFLLLEIVNYSGSKSSLFEVICFSVGFLSPDFFNSYRKYHYVKRVEAGVADALDLFLVCADAGLGMETGMERVAVEMQSLNSAVANEFQLAVSEMKINSDRVKVLDMLGKRTGLVTMRRLSSALIQTLETGSSLSSVLKVLVSEIREDSLTKFEARAARLSVLLTIPMIAFLLPCVFVVIAGPAVISIMRVFSRQ